LVSGGSSCQSGKEKLADVEARAAFYYALYLEHSLEAEVSPLTVQPLVCGLSAYLMYEYETTNSRGRLFLPPPRLSPSPTIIYAPFTKAKESPSSTTSSSHHIDRFFTFLPELLLTTTLSCAAMPLKSNTVYAASKAPTQNTPLKKLKFHYYRNKDYKSRLGSF
jgi:hypothetical protein